MIYFSPFSGKVIVTCRKICAVIASRTSRDRRERSSTFSRITCMFYFTGRINQTLQSSIGRSPKGVTIPLTPREQLNNVSTTTFDIFYFTNISYSYYFLRKLLAMFGPDAYESGRRFKIYFIPQTSYINMFSFLLCHH